MPRNLKSRTEPKDTIVSLPVRVWHQVETFDVHAFNQHFPCTVCIHREKPVGEVCGGCRYYFN